MCHTKTYSNRSVCLPVFFPSPYLSLFPKPSVRGGREERRSYLACREFALSIIFPWSPTCLTCLLYLCRSGFPVVAHLLNLPNLPNLPNVRTPVDQDFPSSLICLTCLTCPSYLCRSGFPVVAQLPNLPNLPLSIGFLLVPEAKSLRRRGSHFMFGVHAHVSLIMDC